MKQFIDQDGRLFGRINIIDVVAIVMVVLLGLIFLYKLSLPNSTVAKSKEDGETVPIVFEGIVRDLPPYMVESIQVGDEIYDVDQETDGVVGVITAIEYMPSTVMMSTPEGQLIYPIMLDYQDLILTIEGEGEVEDGHYRINHIYEIGVNAFRNFYTTYSSFQFTVTEVH